MRRAARGTPPENRQPKKEVSTESNASTATKGGSARTVSSQQCSVFSWQGLQRLALGLVAVALLVGGFLGLLGFILWCGLAPAGF